jgi:hypothetical protein
MHGQTAGPPARRCVPELLMNAGFARITLLLPLLLVVQSGYTEYRENHDQARWRVGEQKMDELDIKTVRFFDLKNVDRLDKDIASFSAILNVAEAQYASNGGINFELSLRYAAPVRIEIHNPLYFIQYSLTGSDKTRLFNNRKPPIPLIHRQGPIDATADFSFSILKIEKGGESLNIQEQVNMPTLAFTQSGEQRYFLQISKFINEGTRQPEDIPGGNYHLEVVFSIIKASIDGKTTENPQSRTLKAQDIAVLYKPQ